MAWQIELSDQVVSFLDRLSDDERGRVLGAIGRLEQAGPNLPTPYAKLINGSRHKNMKELRINYGSCCFRILYAFDTSRKAFLLAAADKAEYGYERFYDDFIPIADDLFERRLDELAGAKVTEQVSRPSKRKNGARKGRV